jgi:hypothetical protein
MLKGVNDWISLLSTIFKILGLYLIFSALEGKDHVAGEV